MPEQEKTTVQDFPNEKVEINLSNLLNQYSLKMLKLNDDGTYIVRDRTSGKDLKVDMKDLYLQENKGLKKEDIEFNYDELGIDKNNPIPISPVAFSDRFKGSLGNEKGFMKYLSKKFDGVDINENNDMVVKKNGAWHLVDPLMVESYDSWDMAKEFVADAIEAVPAIGEGIVSGIGAITGGSAAGVPGLVGGSLLGTAFAAKMRTSLGRLVGTYEATDGEEARDILVDTMFDAAGMGIGAGVKVAAPMFVKMFSKTGATASDAYKAVTGGALKLLHGADGKAIDSLAENPKSVVGLASRMRKELVDDGKEINRANLDDRAAGMQVRSLNNVFSNFMTASKKTFANKEDFITNNSQNLLLKINKNDDLMKTLVRDEIVRIAKKGERVKNFYDPAKKEWKNSFKLKKDTYVPSNKAHIYFADENITIPDVAPGLIRKNNQKLAEFLGIVNGLDDVQMFKGTKGAKEAIELNRALTNVISDLYGKKSLNTGTVFESLNEARKIYSDKLKGGFRGVGMLDNYNDMNNYWRRNAPIRDMIKKLGKDEIRKDKVKNIVNKLNAGDITTKARITDIGLADVIADERGAANMAKELSGDALKDIDLLDNIQAAKYFVLKVPNPTWLLSKVGLPGGKGAIATDYLTGRLGKVAFEAPQIPAGIARNVHGAMKFIKSQVAQMTPAQKTKLVSDEVAIGELFGNLFNPDVLGVDYTVDDVISNYRFEQSFKPPKKEPPKSKIETSIDKKIEKVSLAIDTTTSLKEKKQAAKEVEDIIKYVMSIPKSKIKDVGLDKLEEVEGIFSNISSDIANHIKPGLIKAWKAFKKSRFGKDITEHIMPGLARIPKDIARTLNISK